MIGRGVSVVLTLSLILQGLPQAAGGFNHCKCTGCDQTFYENYFKSICLKCPGCAASYINYPLQGTWLCTSAATKCPDMFCDYAADICTGGCKCTNAPSKGLCFPGNANVQLGNGSTLQMHKLRIGDTVRATKNVVSKVFMFSHSEPESTSHFIQLTTSNGQSLELTEDHYLYVNNDLAQANTVKVGDMLETAEGTTTLVTKIDHIQAEGLFNPHTLHGDILVNGIRTSTYTGAVQPSLAHNLLAPARTLYTMGYNISQ